MIRSESSGDSDDECGPSSEGARKRRYHFITATRNRRSFDGIIDDETRKISITSHPSIEVVDSDKGQHQLLSPTAASGSHLLQSRCRSANDLDRENEESYLEPERYYSAASSGSTPVPGHSKQDSIDDFVVVSTKAHARSLSDVVCNLDTISRSGDELSATEDYAEDSLKPGDGFLNKQLYLLVAQCIAYPFNAKHQIETSALKPKLNEEHFKSIVQTLNSLLQGERHSRYHDSLLTTQEQVVAKNQSFLDCLQWYVDVVLQREDVIEMCKTGRFSTKELENIFKARASKQLQMSPEQRRSLQHTPERKPQLNPGDIQIWGNTFRKLIEHFSRGHVRNSGYAPETPSSPLGGAGTAPNPDKLYKLFQRILKIRTNEHQVLYRECQLGNPDEQEAVVRRELQNRRRVLEDSTYKLGFGSKKVEDIYREEQIKLLKLLNTNLDHLTISSSGVSPQQQKKKRGVITDGGSVVVSKQELQFQLKVKVTIHEAMNLTETKPVFCVFELVEGGGNPLRTQLIKPEGNTARFIEEGEFWTHSPIPQIKFTLRAESKGLLSDDKFLARKTHITMPSTSDVFTTLDLFRGESQKVQNFIGKLRISTVLERPANIKKCGYLSASGDYMFKQLRRRFFALIQLSQYKFLFCTYQPNGSQPKESLLLDQGFSVEYPSTEDRSKEDPEAPVMFVMVSEVSEIGRIRFGCRDDQERQGWMQWLVRATGQNYEPQLGEPELSGGGSDLDRYRLRKVVESVKDITTLDPHVLFTRLFKATLDSRLSSDVFSRGFLSPAQMYVLDEFCARYGVRDPFRHLTCLKEWLDKEETGESIWPVMMLSSFRFCQMHVGGMNPPEKSVIVTHDEKDSFKQVCQKIEEVVTHKLKHFRTCFPFASPKDDLKVTIKLFDLVTVMNHSPGRKNDAVSTRVLTLCMEKAALINYKDVFSKLKLKDETVPLEMPQVFELANMCIEFMYELHGFYWDDFNQVVKAFTAHNDAFWSFFLVDVKEAMRINDDVIVKLQLFHTVNQYFTSQPTMRLGFFHRSFLDEFSHVVESYIDGLETILTEDLANSFAIETWLPVSEVCAAVDGAMKALQSFKTFLDELNWPEENFASKLSHKVSCICANRFKEAAVYTLQQLKALLGTGKVSLGYNLPPHLFTMLNTLVYLSSQVMQVCSSQRVPTAIDESQEVTSVESTQEQLGGILSQAIGIVIEKLCCPLNDILTKLAKYDAKDGILHTLRMMLPTNIPVDSYNSFVANNLALISSHLVSTIFNNFVMNWYELQLQLVYQWLEGRPEYSLHSTQTQSTVILTKSLHDGFSGYDVPEQQLNSESYLAIQDRFRKETSQVDLLSTMN